MEGGGAGGIHCPAVPRPRIVDRVLGHQQAHRSGVVRFHIHRAGGFIVGQRSHSICQHGNKRVIPQNIHRTCGIRSKANFQFTCVLWKQKFYCCIGCSIRRIIYGIICNQRIFQIICTCSNLAFRNGKTGFSHCYNKRTSSRCGNGGDFNVICRF